MSDTNQGNVIVVGGGVIGIACAHYLAQAGRKVTVIDKGQIGGECSYANCGYICPSHVPPLTEPGAFKVALKSLVNPKSPFRVKPSFSPKLIKWMLQFASRCTTKQMLAAGSALQAILDLSMAEYRKLITAYHFNCEWEEQGLLYVFSQPHAYDDFVKLNQFLIDHFGVAATSIAGADLPDFDSGLREGLHGGFHYPGDTSVRPDLLNKAWTRHLKQQGVEFRERCELLDVVADAGRVQTLTTSQGALAADHYVFALGAISARWSRQLGIEIPIQPGKGYSITLERPENCPRHPILFPEKKVGVSPFAQGMRLGSMMEFVGYDSTIPAMRLQQLRDAARPYLRADVDGPAQEKWFGWRPMTWDSLPIIGQIPKLSNSFLATGHNMIGLTLAPATGRLVAELVTGQPTAINLAPYACTRF